MSPVPFLDMKRVLAEDRPGLIQAFTRVLDSGRFILGKELQLFEAEFAAYCGTDCAVGVGNGLDALYLALKSLGVGPGDEVIVPAHTFVATWLAVTRCGATPVAAEPDPHTCLATAASIEVSLSSRTKAVVAVHLYGALHGIEDVATLCRDKGLPLIEDAAQAHGAHSSGIRAGNFGVAGCFSFYPSKNLGCLGDGGAVVTSNLGLAETLRKLRNYGSDSRYQHDLEGINSRLDELQAALLHVRMASLDTNNARRQELAARYLRRLAGIPGLQLPTAGTPGSHVWHQFVVQTDRRDELQEYLSRNGCETLIHYPQPVYRFPPFAAFAPAAATVADSVASRVLSLPIGHYLPEADVDLVSEAVRRFFT